ncbi:hypothetical protein [Ramlibacter albus]|uniref:Uncharacterized protein n=1 Tax=Ramlibacter albus TaxID=2079448 RepID=A0A923M826_9BURK|nr:hypothetical protein [Ramlibacter albus]MBC5764267.1 hypothetical protein [Ramlibacter albus]
MRNVSIVIAGLVAAGSVALVGCDVKKTQEGNLEVPKYEVSKTKEGDVTLPKYDVTPPSVDVKTKEAEVLVPKVGVKEETIKVPSVDIKTGKEKNEEKQAAAPADAAKK